MNTVSDVLGNAGGPIVATLGDGREVHVKRLDQAAKTRIEQHLKATAKAEVMEWKADLTDAEFAIVSGAFLDRTASADYKFGGRIFTSFMQSGSGGLFVMRLLGKWGDGKDITENDLVGIMMNPNDQAALTLSVKQAIDESFPKGLAPTPGPGSTGATSPLAL